MTNTLSQFMKSSGPRWQKIRQKALSCCAHLDRFCAKLNSGLTAVALVLLMAVVVADASDIVNAIDDLSAISADGNPVLLGP
jgi:hypothetical protein